MTRTFIARIAFDSLLFISAVLGVWWAAVLLGIVGIFLFPRFYEVVFAGILIDALYGVPVWGIGFSLWYTLGAALLYGIIQAIRRRLRFYE